MLLAPRSKKTEYFQKNPVTPAASSNAINIILIRPANGRWSKATNPLSNASNQPPFDPDQYKQANVAVPYKPIKKQRAARVSRCEARHKTTNVGGSKSSIAPAK